MQGLILTDKHRQVVMGGNVVIYTLMGPCANFSTISTLCFRDTTTFIREATL